jgi:protein tyrosine/serine phosphatase
MRPDGLKSIIGPQDGPPAPRFNAWRRLGLWLHTLFVDHGIFRTFFNTRSRVSDELWRSSQPLPYQIASAKRAGIKTIVNLRGASQNPFYLLEEEACRRHGLTLVNFVVYSRDVPARETLHEAKAMFDGLDYPALIHCKSGADRAGLMGALYLMLRKGRPVEEALSQLSLAYGHVRQGKTGMLDYFLERYRDDNAEEPQTFLDWADTKFDRPAIMKGFHASWWANVLVDRLLRRE